MSSIFPLSASAGQNFQGYEFDGTRWNLIGSEFNPTSFSSEPPVGPKPGDLWIDSNDDVDIIDDQNLVFQNDLDSYATLEYVDQELESIDALPSQTGNEGKFLTTSGSAASWATVDLDLSGAINTASAAAVSYLVDSAPEALDTLNELAAALGDDPNYATTITNSLGNKLNISTASSTYLTQTNASTIYAISASMQTVPVYVMNTGTTDQRPVSASAGMFRFNTTSKYPEWYDPETSMWVKFYEDKPLVASYLLIAGGGGGGQARGGGGGAGGYLTNTIPLQTATLFNVTIGGGGGGSGSNANKGGTGTASLFSTITAQGGGGGGSSSNTAGATGGSGGGGTFNASGAAGTSGQGFDGGNSSTGAGGGGGAGAVGVNGTGGASGAGGVGLSSTITGSLVTRGGGGGGGNEATAGSGGAGGGGNGGAPDQTPGQGGAANTGGGGGGGGRNPGNSFVGAGGSGGSGILIISYPSLYTITIGAGLTGSTATVGANKVTTITAGTGNVSFA